MSALAQSDGHYAPKLIDDLVPSVAAMVDDFVVHDKRISKNWGFSEVKLATGLRSGDGWGHLISARWHG